MFSCLIIFKEKFIPGLFLKPLNIYNLLIQDLFLARWRPSFTTLPIAVLHMHERLLCKLTFVFNSQAKYRPYCLNLHFLMTGLSWDFPKSIANPYWMAFQTKKNVLSNFFSTCLTCLYLRTN